MITELRVENLGIIEELLVRLGPGMTAITGETGAGKTLLVTALDLLLGGRADSRVVRASAAEARVEARLLLGDDEMVLTRVVPVEGRSRAYIDGRLATVAELAERTRAAVDLHGQHDHQSLLQPAVQRALLDRFAGPEALAARDDYRTCRAELRAIAHEMDALGGDQRARAREIDLLRYQLDEIAEAAIADPDEEAQLERDERLLAAADEHRDALALAHDDLERDAADAIGAAVARLDATPFDDMAERARALQSELGELARDVRMAGEAVVADPERLAELRARRQRLRELCRKYGATLADVVAYRDEIAQRLAELEGHDARVEALVAAQARVEAAMLAAARRLRRARDAAAAPLGERVTEHLHELAMPAARFTVRVDDGEATDDGTDDVTFLLAANTGEDARALARAASGGELSRAMLGLRVVLSEAPPVLVFDEVDAGIGGEAGLAVGRALATLGGTHQVLCVTHLPQVAAFADAQLIVTKHEEGGRTIASAALALDEARVSELSRMLAGVGASAHARRHAEELLERAGEQRALARA
ncbi:MAG TPA: DNA repair protein RecN [Acidimicrobiia bacterium]|nr:DNA repair protein RecN [Acidimicrobiia bacterium]